MACEPGLAFVAVLLRRNADGLLGAARRFFQRNLKVVAQIGSAIDVGAATSTTATENIAENIAESVGEAVEALAAARAHARVNACVAVAIIGGALVGFRKHFVGFLHFLEMPFRIRVAEVAIGVILHRQLAIGFFQIGIGGVAIDAQNFVVVALGHWGGLQLF